MRPEGNYYECLCKRKNTTKGYALRAFLIFLIVLCFALTAVIGGIMLIVGAVGAYLLYLATPRFHVTYEYVFCDGQIDFDKILGGEGRKHDYRVDLESVEMVAPENSHALDNYRNSDLKVVDYSSLIKSPEHKVYVIINNGKKGMEKILFEPDETFVTMMKQKSPRKVSEY